MDGGLKPVSEEDVIRVRNKAARAVQAVFRNLNLAPVSDEQVEAVTYAHGSKDTLPATLRRIWPPLKMSLREASPASTL